MGKKKPFIDRSSAAHFTLVHRSQRDPKSADPDAPQRVLAPSEVGQRKGTSDRASQSTRAWLEEQDLGGFETEVPSAQPQSAEDFADLGFGEDGYNYSQHLRTIKTDGLFIPAVGASGSAAAQRGPASVASAAQSTTSRASRLSRASLTLRGVPEEALESAEELPYGVGGAHNEMNVIYREEDSAYLQSEMDEDLWAALHESSGDEEDDEDDIGEIDDDFVLQADRTTELLPVPERPKRVKKKAPAASAKADDDGEGADDEDEEDEEDEEEAPGYGGGEAAAGAGARRAGEEARKGGSAAVAGGDEEGERTAAVERRNPFFDMFASDDEEDARQQERGRRATAIGSGDDDDDDDDDGLSILGGTESVSGGGSRQVRLLDERFSKLLSAEYSDDEIGELDADDPRVNGHEDLETFDSVLDEYLMAQKAKFVYVNDLMDTGSSRAWARPQREEHAPPASGAASRATSAPAIDAAGNTVEGGADGDVSDAESDGSIEQHPFFDGLREKPKEEKWDAETILSTYTTTENHPTTIRVARKPRPGKAAITLDPRTGLPVGTMLPAEEERRKYGAGEEDEDEDEEGDGWGGVAVNEGEARPRKENGEEKRQRKAAVKAAKATRRQDKKGTKQAFATELSAQVHIRRNTAHPSQIGLSGFGN